MDNQEKSTVVTAPPQDGTPPSQNPQSNPQYNPQFSPQYNPQFNPQFSPQLSPGQIAALPPQAVNPQTGQPNPNVIVVQVPSSDPGTICAQHGHIPVTTYGPLGRIIGILCFPIGLIALFLDRTTTCRRCGATLSKGIS